MITEKEGSDQWVFHVTEEKRAWMTVKMDQLCQIWPAFNLDKFYLMEICFSQDKLDAKNSQYETFFL